MVFLVPGRGGVGILSSSSFFILVVMDAVAPVQSVGPLRECNHEKVNLPGEQVTPTPNGPEEVSSSNVVTKGKCD